MTESTGCAGFEDDPAERRRLPPRLNNVGDIPLFCHPVEWYVTRLANRSPCGASGSDTLVVALPTLAGCPPFPQGNSAEGDWFGAQAPAGKRGRVGCSGIGGGKVIPPLLARKILLRGEAAQPSTWPGVPPAGLRRGTRGGRVALGTPWAGCPCHRTRRGGPSPLPLRASAPLGYLSASLLPSGKSA